MSKRRAGTPAQGGERQRPGGSDGAPAGLAARRFAAELIGAVLDERRSLDEAFAGLLQCADFARLEGRDRAYARLVAATVLRRLGELDAVIGAFLEKPLPARTGLLRPILLAGAAQLLFLNTPPHAAISLAVDLVRTDPRARRFDRLTNAVLRRVAERGAEVRANKDGVRLNVPDWMWRRWEAAYGAEVARRIAEASLREAALDLTVKSDAAGWAERLGGTELPTGSVRVASHGRIDELAGFAEGAWWVQDAAAALPARMLGRVAGASVADVCAAPGGKTAQLAAAGARVTAVDASEARLGRLKENLGRLGLEAETVAADAAAWNAGRTFDAVLLDAPCTATGTIRRHPDILHLKRETDVAALAAIQSKLLEHSASLVRPGGLLVYCTCSLEREEGAEQVRRFLAANAQFERVPIDASETGGLADLVSGEGDLRSLPFHLDMGRDELSGIDGFFAARLKRTG